MKEQELIRWIRDRTPAGEGVVTGIGDDAAVIDAPPGGRIVVTTDLLMEGTHFLTVDPPEEVGWKALAVSVSDVAAMGCRARAAVLAIALRRELADYYAKKLLEGVESLARATGVALVGGDTTESSGPVAICSTVLGEPPSGGEPVLRSGARAGQDLLVTGSLGGGLGTPPPVRAATGGGAGLVSRVSVGAMIDVSDGLSSDAWHLARESGVKLRISAEAVPLSPAAAGAEDGRAPLQHALDDGEDFELLFTVAREDSEALVEEGLAGNPVTRIGEVLAGGPEVTLIGTDGREAPLLDGGYEHFG